MMQNFKLYLAAISIDVFIVQLHISEFWQKMDDSLRTLTMLAAFIVTILTAVKLYQDITKTKLEKKKLRIDIKKQEGQS